MAMTATISVSPSTVKTGQKCTATLTISNSGASTVYLTSAQGYVLPTGGGNDLVNTGVAISPINTGPNASLAVQPSGTLVKTFDIKWHGPQSGTINAAADTFEDGFDVGAICYSDDGSVFSPTVTTVTVDYAVTFPESQQ